MFGFLNPFNNLKTEAGGTRAIERKLGKNGKKSEKRIEWQQKKNTHHVLTEQFEFVAFEFVDVVLELQQVDAAAEGRGHALGGRAPPLRVAALGAAPLGATPLRSRRLVSRDAGRQRRRRQLVPTEISKINQTKGNRQSVSTSSTTFGCIDFLVALINSIAHFVSFSFESESRAETTKFEYKKLFLKQKQQQQQQQRRRRRRRRRRQQRRRLRLILSFWFTLNVLLPTV